MAASTKMERLMWNPFLSMKNSLEFETYILCLISDTGGGRRKKKKEEEEEKEKKREERPLLSCARKL